ncbi:MAG: hypothetical protein GH148_08575 [Clostridia bacterium]|nr:hypothetical protein [Clostridia bacterium]
MKYFPEEAKVTYRSKYSNIEDYKVVKKILDYLKIYESQRKRPLPVKPGELNKFDCCMRDDYIDYNYIDI